MDGSDASGPVRSRTIIVRVPRFPSEFFSLINTILPYLCMMYLWLPYGSATNRAEDEQSDR